MSNERTELKHATFLRLATLGVLILGKPGAGKSTLALSLIDSGGRGIAKSDLIATLVADDQVCLWQDETSEQIYGAPPETLAGLLEIRGVGIAQVDYIHPWPVNLVVELKPLEDVERLPDFPNTCMDILGQAIPVLSVSVQDTAAPARIRAAIGILLHSNTVENDGVIG